MSSPARQDPFDASAAVESGYHEHSAQSSRSNARWILAATIIASAMAFIDSTVVNIAIPAMQAEFNVGLERIQWVVETYALLLSALILLGGSLGDRYGRRRVFLSGTGSFAVASILCAVAPNLWTLNIARALQGVGAAMLVPSSLAIISASFPVHQRGAAIGTWTAFSALTTALGPAIGGLIVDFVSWRWIFVVNAPLAAAVWWISRRSIQESYGRSGDKIDLSGALLITSSLGCLVFGLAAWGEGAHGIRVWVPATLGAGFMVMFLWIEATSKNAMLPLRFFANRTFSVVNTMTLLIYTALAGLLYFLPFNLIQVQGWSTLAAGAAFMPFSGIMFVLARLGGALADHHGPRLPLTAGCILTGLGFLGFVYIPQVVPNYLVAISLATVIMAVGMSMVVPPLTTVAMTCVEDGFEGVASGINNAVARVAGLIGVAVFTVIALRLFTPTLDTALAASGLPTPIVQELKSQSNKLAGIELNANWTFAEKTEAKRMIGVAFMRAFEWTCYVAAALLGCAAMCAGVGLGRSTEDSR